MVQAEATKRTSRGRRLVAQDRAMWSTSLGLAKRTKDVATSLPGPVLTSRRERERKEANTTGSGQEGEGDGRIDGMDGRIV